ncbi:polyprenyl diphosphate synthase [Chlamydiifrater phoenicopteri]|uniref:polyprenyl diphosphate synthase n=1 Tax=Chlamydiifrater phoenicopteri TaxID=2681469 RepID=UPI001BCDD942|nr:polyprenyl diphosphate synthase [Chlamydiifrater phoenicopteri]
MSNAAPPTPQAENVKNSRTIDSIISRLRKKSIPRHVAIIMDGNRRWSWLNSPDLAKEGIFKGHQKGAEVLMDLIPTTKALGIETLTLFAFSTENRNRAPKEVAQIFSLICHCIDEKKSWLKEQGIKFECIGNLEGLPEEVREKVLDISEETKDQNQLRLALALNYGAKDEIVRAFKKIHQDLLTNKIALNNLTEDLVSSYLDTAKFGNPDLLIRTGGEMRVSNFLLWQIAYTELYMTKVLWPNFGSLDFIKAIWAFQKRCRRGGL